LQFINSGDALDEIEALAANRANQPPPRNLFKVLDVEILPFFAVVPRLSLVQFDAGPLGGRS
jgi:hypothetical protein